MPGSFLTTAFRFSSITGDLTWGENAEECHLESPGLTRVQAEACDGGREGETLCNELYRGGTSGMLEAQTFFRDKAVKEVKSSMARS